MRTLLHILGASILFVFYACGGHQSASDVAKNDNSFDFSQFYRVASSDEYIYDAHHNVPLGEKVTLNDLDRIFGVPLICDTVMQTSDEWSLFEQEVQAAHFLPAATGDTLVMMRRIYGHEGDWLTWIDLEISDTDSLRVLGFIAYNNSMIDI